MNETQTNGKRTNDTCKQKRYEISINLTIQGLYVKTRADNSGYRNHRVICLVVICSSFDSEQVFQVSNGYLCIVFEKWTLDKKLNQPRCWSDDNSSTFFLRNVELKSNLLIQATA